LGEPAVLDVMLNIENLDLFATRDCDIDFSISFDGKVCAEKVLKRELLTSGTNYIHFEIELPNAKLWWPNGYGGQPLYDVAVSAVCDGVRTEYPPFRYGVRTVALDVSPLQAEGEERLFTWVVNGTPIFCKGGDWIPGDSIYARVSDHKYAVLIQEAVEANFNALRVWGGGLYEKDIFYELCDRHGILLWHDFMFACSTYPDHREAFREEVRREMDYQTKRLRSHPCMGIWCGNNEDHEIFFQNAERKGWGLDYSREKQYGLYASNVIAKQVIHANCPEIPYWNSSPYGGALPFGQTAGDVHYWGQAMMSPDMENRIDPFVYDKITAKFVSEYGYIGPCVMDSIREYFDGRPVERGSAIWNHHNNAFEKQTVLAGIEKHYGIRAEDLSLEDYLTYAGAVHGLLLGYSLEAIRFKANCAGAIFWMYNDTWGEVGWTIVDYYLRRKIAYYGVKRAFLPQKISLRAVDGEAVVQLCNDRPEPIDVPAQYGYVSFDGKVRDLRDVRLTAASRSRSYVLRESLPDCDWTRGALVVLPAHTLQPASLYLLEHKKRILPPASVALLSCEPVGGDMRLTLHSDVFAHHVTLHGEYRFSDNYFDLLPGETREVIAYGTDRTDWTLTSIQ
ncbi:MAG: glycoside hydrolase family 2 protein, partial [Candidatus Spyradocola sp.]